MNSVKIAYMILSGITGMAFVGLAVASPIWITPGYYWWTAFGIIMFFLGSLGFTERVNGWKDFGHN